MKQLIANNSSEKKLIVDFCRYRKEVDFRELYSLHSKRTHSIIYRLLNFNSESSKEVLQMTWVRAIEKIDSFQFKSLFSTWLIGIAVNCCSEFRRKNMLTYDLRDDSIISEQDEQRIVNAIDFNDMLNQLPEGYREVFIMHDIEGYTHEQISKKMSFTIGNSKSQLHHARKQMYKLLSIV